MIKWTLKNYLDNNDLSAYKLVQAAKVSPTTVYALARGDHERVSLEVLDKVLAGLERLTGKPATLTDVLEREPDPEPQEEIDAETRAWLEVDLAPPLEPYEWGDVDPETIGEPVQFDPKKGWSKSE